MTVNIQTLKARHDFLVDIIKDVKKNRNQKYREGRKYSSEYGHHLNSEASTKHSKYLAIHGIKQEGIAGYLDYKRNEYAVEFRALSIAIAYLRNKRFDSIERFWYNLSMSDLWKQKFLTISQLSDQYGSVYGDRYGRQQQAICKAKFYLGMFRYEQVRSPYSNRFSHNKIVYENDEEFNEWIKVTSKHFFEDLSPISLTQGIELNRDSLAGEDLNPIVQWTKERNTGS